MIPKFRLILQLTVGIVFFASALGKMWSPQKFAEAVRDYRVVPSTLAFTAALALIFVEALLSGSYLTGWFLPLTLPLGITTVLIMAIVVSINLRRGRYLPCHCFGAKGTEKISGRTLLRLMLLFLAELIVFSDRSLFGRNWPWVRSNSAGLQRTAFAFLWSGFLLIGLGWLLNVATLFRLIRPWSLQHIWEKQINS